MNAEGLRLDQVTCQDFEPYVGQEFGVAVEEGGACALNLILAEATESDYPGNPRKPFSLFFEGPVETALPQQIYWLSHLKTGTLGIFLVPIGVNEQCRKYQAVFN